MIDGVIVPVAAIATLVTASHFGIQGIYSAFLAGLVVFILEPLLVSITGGTPGHHLIGIQVKSKKTGKNINIFSAIIRFVTKIILGLFSLIAVFITKQHQAIHDAIAGSIVVIKNPNSKSNHEVLKEREVELPGYSYPSNARRFVMIVVYNIVFFITLGIALSLIVPDQCLTYSQCSTLENTLLISLQLLWVVSVISSIVLCWKGLLPGCRRQLIAEF